MTRKRRKFSGSEKVAMLRRHLVEGVAVSRVCEDAGIQPTQFYDWQRRFFEDGEGAVLESQSGEEACAPNSPPHHPHLPLQECHQRFVHVA